MARDAVAISPLTLNDGIAPMAGVAIVPANGVTLAAGGETRRLWLEVANTAATPKNFTVQAGDDPPAFRAGLGNLVVAVPNGATRLICVESARFAQGDGSIEGDFETGMTGTVRAYRLPDAL